MRKLVTAFFGLLIAAAPAAAQGVKPVDINFGFGWAFPSGDFSKEFDAGWNGTIGATFNFNPHLGIQAEYIYASMGGPSKTIPISSAPGLAAATNGVIDSNHQMHIGSFNLVYHSSGNLKGVGGYLLGGAGIYHRIVQLTSPAVGYTTICDPYWYVCYPAAVSVDQVLGDRSSNDFGYDIGGGITFGARAKFYIESRFHYVWGKTINPTASTLPSGAAVTTTCSSGCSTNASYLPLTFGLRF